ncbi:MAG: ATP-binding cassette domain-containing protein [Lachnospiraceae bacterium]|nr:ATP-binding cassette domain-containing protein [Lachnospiraceae bacterium]
MDKPVIQVKNLYKIYRIGENKVRALNGVDFTIKKGEFCCIVGTSGSGKSTLLNMMAGLEPPTKGQIVIAGEHIERKNESQLVMFRQAHVGFIFQSYNLMPNLTAVENVAMPLTFQGVPRDIREKRAVKMLKMVGLGKFLDHRPGQMSGGQQQRVGIARALVVNPEIVFADEPTGNLDSNTTLEVLKLMQRIVHEKGQTMVMVTHDNYLASFGDKVIHIRDGKIIRVEEHPGGAIENVENLSADSLPGGTLAVPGGTLAKPVENSAAQYQQIMQPAQGYEAQAAAAQYQQQTVQPAQGYEVQAVTAQYQQTVQPAQNIVQPAPADMTQAQQPWVQQPQAYTAQTAGPDIMRAQQMAVQTPQEYTVQPAAVTAPEYIAQNVMSGEIPGQQ